MAPKDEKQSSLVMVIIGVAFILLWLFASAIWFVMSMMGALMANDSGAASSESHTIFLLAMLFGQSFTALSGIAAGLSFFWRSRRRPLLIIFAILIVLGVGSQLLAFKNFVTKINHAHTTSFFSE